MDIRRLTSLVLPPAVIVGVAVAVLAAQQPVRLGPKVRARILDSKVDPSFSSTTIKRVLLLPFANELDYPEGAQLLEANLLSEMQRTTPDLTIQSSQATLQLLRERNLSERYRLFVGNYLNTGVATTDFLVELGKVGQADGILMARVLEFAERTTRTRISTGFGIIQWSRSRAVVGMDLRLLRTRDGRELWWGVHAMQGERVETVRDLARGVGEVIARYFGRPPF
ncbi:MAG: hypothetical protein IT184_00535 [Acidobacteria bacterium]|nr:hypothetical protein [Acidobacteriota bacterium]